LSLRLSFVVLALVGAVPASAQVAAVPPVEPAADDPTFGPLIEIEAIEVRGNATTATRIVVAAMPLAPGDVLRAGDRRLRDAERKLLALGFFRAVDVSLRKGSARGKVVVLVEVVERGTVTLNRIYLGISEAVPWWLGVDVSDRNLAGSGVEVGVAAVRAARSDIDGGDSQWAAQLRAGASGVGGSRVGVHGARTHIDASEPYRVAGAASDGDPALFAAFPYRRTGGKLGVGIDVTPLSQVSLDARLERVVASLPPAPIRVREDGSTTAVDLALHDGTSWVATLSLGFERDTRPDPVLPFGGDRFVVVGELGTAWTGSDYDFATLLVRYERWLPVSGVAHVVSLHATGGVVLGDAPRFDRFYVGDVNRLLSPRALGLVVSTQPPRDALGTSADEQAYGEVAGLLELEYSYRLFRSRGPIYGGDLFVGAGVVGVATRDQLGGGEDSQSGALPLDLSADAGLRLDTEVGIFELTLANALGRVPL
jgi:outer membrane protein assembly factor BamA